MNLTSKFAILMGLLLVLNACVTTRSEWNREHGISDQSGDYDDSASSAPDDSVQSEDLRAKSGVTPSSTAPSSSTVSSAPPATAPMTATGSTSSTTPSVAASGTASGAVAPVPALPPSGGYNIEELRAQVAQLTGKVEELQHQKQLDDQAHADEKKKLEDQVAGLEKQLQELQPQALEVPEGKTALDAGKDAYFGGLYPQAIQYLDQYLQKNDKLDSKKAIEATYIRGESYYKLKQYKKAIVDFSKFPERYQKSPYHPKALLRIAESFDALGMKDDAKAFYSELVDRFPKTAEGKLAKKRLKKK